MNRVPVYQALCLLAAAFLLPACGGGGSGGGSPLVLGEVEFAAALAAAVEGDGTVTLSVNRTGGNRAVSVQWASSAGSAVDGADFTGASGTLDWTSDDLAPKDIVVAIGGLDAALDGPRTFTVTLTAPVNATLGVNAASLVTIADADTPGVVEFASATGAVAEGGTSISLSVTRTGGTVPVSVLFDSANGTATAGADYTAVGSTLTWAAGDFAPQNIVVDVAGADALLEGDETFTVTLSAPGGATLGANTVNTVTIGDADTAAVVQFAATSAGVSEGGVSVGLSVTRTGGTVPVSVVFASANGTAAAGADYTAAGGTLTWAAGDFTSQNIVVDIAGADALLEGDETFTVTLSLPSGAALGANTVSTVTIGDADTAAVVQFAATSAGAPEGGAPVSLSVTRVGGTVPVTVTFASANGTATAGADYTAVGSTLTWAAGDFAPQNIVVDIAAADALLEGDETFTVTLSAPSGATLGANTVNTVTIAEGDTAAVVQFAATSASVAEGGVSVTLNVTRIGGTVPVSVQFATANLGATAGSDYTAAASSVSWTAGDFVSKDVVVFISDPEGVFEGDETFTVTLSAPSGATIGANAVATVTITEADPPPPVPALVEFLSATAAVLEGDGLVLLEVTRTGGTADVSVGYSTSDGSAAAGQDYSATSGSLNWLAGDFTSRFITVPIADLEGVVEGIETFTVSLNALTGATLGPKAVATVSIGDADAPPDGVFQFSAAVYAVVEGAGAPVDVTITVQRTGGTFGAVQVECLVSAGTAAAGSDYTAPAPNPVLLQWADGDGADKTFTIQIEDDAADAAGVETILLALQNPDTTPPSGLGPELSPALSVASVEVTDRDQPGQLEFSAPSYQVSEAGSQVTIPVRRVNGAGGAVTVDVTLAGLAPAPAAAGLDYVDPGPIQLAWADGDIADQSFTILLIDNSAGDGSRVLRMTLENPTGAALSGANNPANLTIADDEAGFFEFSQSAYVALEGDAGTSILTITVNRNNGSVGAAAVEVVVSDGTATSPADYTAPAGPVLLLLADGETSKTFDLTIVGDADFEGDETILLSFQNPTGASVGGTATSTVTLTNDDAAPGGTLVLSSNSYAAAEGTATVTVTINRTGLTTLPVSVTFRTLNGSAKGNGKNRDYFSTNQTVNFAIGETSKTVDVTIVDDLLADPGETFRISLSNPLNGAVLGTPFTGTVSIADND